MNINKDLILKWGDEQIDLAELNKGYTEYMQSDGQNKKYKVKRTRKEYRWLLILPLLYIITFRGCVPPSKIITYTYDTHTKATAEIQEIIEKIITQNITGDEAILNNLSQMETGDNLYFDTGIPYYESSDHNYGGVNNSGIIGNSLRAAGDYEINYVSLVNKLTGEIIQVEYSPDQNIGNFIETLLNQNNLNISDTEIQLHIPDTGWVDARDISSLSTSQKKYQFKFPIFIK